MTDHYTAAATHLAAYHAARNSALSPLPAHEHLTLAAVEANLAIAEAINRARLEQFLAPIPYFDDGLNQTGSADFNDDDPETLREV